MPLIDRQGEGRVIYGVMDLYGGQPLTWALVGRPDLAALAGKTISTVNGPYVVPLAPPPIGPRYSDGRVYGAVEPRRS